MPEIQPSLFTKIENEISTYTSQKVELSPEVFFSQYELINRIYKFSNHDQSGEKLNSSDLSYNYWFDIISPRVDSEIKNLRFDTKNILVFSQNPRKDFAVVFLANASLKNWMAENGEDIKLKTAVERFTANGNVGFKKVSGGYEFTDDINTYITNIKAETVEDTAIVERYELLASQLKGMVEWDQQKIDTVIQELGNKTFTAAPETTPIESSEKRYEIFERTGEVSEEEYNEILGIKGGSKDIYFLAKIVVAGLHKNKKDNKYVLFAEKLPKGKKMSDYYVYAHRGKYTGRFWRVGMYELLFDHQVRANQIGNDLAKGLEWASKTIFRSSDQSVLQNLRADLENGDVLIAKDLTQVNVRMQGLDQLIADWNRLMSDADRLSNSYEVVRGESMPSGTPFRMGMLMDENAGKMFVLLRQKISLPFKKVFREWVLPELFKSMEGKDVFMFTGEEDLLDQLREVIVDSWYVENLVKIGPHTKEVGDAIRQEKLDEIKKVDPVLKNVKDAWKNVIKRTFVTITGENSNIADHLQDLMALIPLESDPVRIAWILDTMYKIRGIPIPPKQEQPAPAQLLNNAPTQPAQAGEQGQTPPEPGAVV